METAKEFVCLDRKMQVVEMTEVAYINIKSPADETIIICK